MIAGILSSSVSSPPSISRVTSIVAASPDAIASFEAKVPCAQPSRAASIWPVWLQSSSIACLPRMTRRGFSLATIAFSSLATASGCSSASVTTWMPRSAPIASAVRIVSCACCGPIDTAMISVAMPFSLSRIASSTPISSNGFIDILTLAVSTPLPSGFHPDFDIEIDDALDRDQDLHRTPLVTWENCVSCRFPAYFAGAK